jgi:hypothetical protein
MGLGLSLLLPSGHVREEAAGKRDGTSGTTIGHVYLTWAFSSAAELFRRAYHAEQTYLGRLETPHGQGQAVTVMAHKRARVVDDMVPRHRAFDLHTFVTG